MAEGLKGAVALVTGASSGIGAETVKELAALGCKVICAGRRRDKLEEAAKPVGGHVLELDVTSRKSVESLIDRLPAPWREIDILVNNAGHDTGGRRRFDEGTLDEWESIIETNVIGLVRVTRVVIPGMIARDRGHVVNIGSISGYKPYAGGTLYAGSKFAVHGFSESLRLDYRNSGVRVTEILPGMVRTGFATARWGDATRAKKFYDDFGVCLNPEDVARTVAFAVQQPKHVVISQLVVVPNSQT
jgi:3-hydroxy acid dehydrogenase / malonic semialdehyde reductase